MWNRKESPHARIPVSHPPCTPPLPTHLLPYVPGCSSLDVFTAASSVHTRSQIPVTRRRSADDVIANHAHSAVSRPRPRMDNLGRKGRGGRGGGYGRDRKESSARAHPCIPSTLYPPLPTHLLPYVSGCSSSDVFTAASSVHTGSRDPIPRGPRSQVPAARSADDLIAHHGHSAVSRPRPRMDSLGRKGRGGRGVPVE